MYIFQIHVYLHDCFSCDSIAAKAFGHFCPTGAPDKAKMRGFQVELGCFNP